MRNPKEHSKSGFTLIELLIAIALGSVTALMIMLVTTNGIANIKNSKNAERLHANAIFLTDMLTFRIKDAEFISIPSADTLVLTLPDSSTDTITIANEKVTLNGNILTSSDISVKRLNFTPLQKSVLVEMSFTTGINDSYSATTTISYRNQPI